jgi:hypothetical protein
MIHQSSDYLQNILKLLWVEELCRKAGGLTETEAFVYNVCTLEAGPTVTSV